MEPDMYDDEDLFGQAFVDASSRHLGLGRQDSEGTTNSDGSYESFGMEHAYADVIKPSPSLAKRTVPFFDREPSQGSMLMRVHLYSGASHITSSSSVLSDSAANELQVSFLNDTYQRFLTIEQKGSAWRSRVSSRMSGRVGSRVNSKMAFFR
eukprot:CAMPEP_0198722822 /NCGR_PEP_ID=MMETSP1475-20131203/434_1 /TAXON_ID= ORGANISM="Unidentified sp., Strain CCMP1999" /NCGR_SAMPLE_ID=MMETSP1475 /ASSEMBLY_ACC=CAM_ASM_001111 /LENGTH=151 /DNA_ID=CAMNT_0044483745 /DNA_START=174 /DNA_END=629 /DNA_ORIENTATION=+